MRARRVVIAGSFLSFIALSALGTTAHAQGAAGTVAGSAAAEASQVGAHTGAATAAQGATAIDATTLDPTRDAAVAGVRVGTADERQMQETSPRRSKDVALMIVGGAGIVVGAIVGDEAGTIITVAGAVLLLYGLYHFLDH